MKSFVLQNRDYNELYWSSEYGWADLDHADQFFGTELDDAHCVELVKKTQGKWCMQDTKLNLEQTL